MTPRQLERAGIELFGHQWQSTLARAIGYKPRQIRRYYAAELPIPLVVNLAIMALIGIHRGDLKPIGY